MSDDFAEFVEVALICAMFGFLVFPPFENEIGCERLRPVGCFAERVDGIVK